jgi:Zn-finger nucleic acid-binding protein
MPARAYACTACGARVDEQSRRCRYCDAPVATVRCATCFHMNVPDAAYCCGCGRGLGLEPVGQAGELACPVCQRALDAYPSGAGALFDCGACGGQFVEHALLHEMLERHEHVAHPDGAASAPWRPDPHPHYIPCPACRALMNRKNFGGMSGVIVDVCKKHGTWFDLGELPRVLAFVAGGGLAKSRARTAEEEARLRREAAAASIATGASVDPRHMMSDGHQHIGESLAKMFVDLLLH